jgi:DNA polymerase elongation subunit (family B)
VQYYSVDSRLTTLTRLNESDVEPPPFSILYFEISTSSSPYSLDSHSTSDPISRITASYQEEPELTFEDNEEKMLTDFCEYVLAKKVESVYKTRQLHLE